MMNSNVFLKLAGLSCLGLLGSTIGIQVVERGRIAFYLLGLACLSSVSLFLCLRKWWRSPRENASGDDPTAMENLRRKLAAIQGQIDGAPGLPPPGLSGWDSPQPQTLQTYSTQDLQGFLAQS